MKTTLITPARLPVSAIGCGCTTFGREIDEAAAHIFLDHAQANGITFLDTASAYGSGNGESEAAIRSWLESRQPAANSVVIATKILPPYTPKEMQASVDLSLQRLGIEAIDLLYLHRHDDSADSVESLAALDALVRSGKVRSLGVSNYTQAQLKAAFALQDEHGLTRFAALQNNFNYAVRDVGPGYREYCDEQNVAVVTYSPLGAGFLTGKHKRESVESGSRFDIVPGHQDVYFHDEGWSRLARLEQIAADSGHSQAHLALAWAMHQPGIDSVLVGGRTPAHLDQALAAQAFDDAEIFAALDAE